MLFSQIFRKDRYLELARLPARNPRSAEIESSELGNKSFRYPSLHMFLQFTFARRLDFKMLISNSAIKRAGDQEKRNEKKNIRIYMYIEPRATRNTCCSRSRKSWSKLSLRHFREGRWFTGWSLWIGCSTRGGVHTHTYTRIQRD